MQSSNMKKTLCFVVSLVTTTVIVLLGIIGFEFLYRSKSSPFTMLPIGTKMKQQSVIPQNTHTENVQLSAVIRTRPPTKSPICPTSQPSMQPSMQPSSKPTQPSGQPTRQPTTQPSRQPTSRPTHPTGNFTYDTTTGSHSDHTLYSYCLTDNNHTLYSSSCLFDIRYYQPVLRNDLTRTTKLTSIATFESTIATACHVSFESTQL